ncbi:OmpA family protein [Marinomonas atlantica]|uniref:OmpA family protein n=1 Tax=Marinomonas atlantica TaxID=1806668 RepID=UPI0008307CEE|nr:OmpA family protein [Marinomonas atlantica]
MLKRFGAFSFTVLMGLATPTFNTWASDVSVNYDDAIVSASQFDQDLMQQHDAQDIAMFIPNIRIGDTQQDINSLIGTPYSVQHQDQKTHWDYNVSIPRSVDSFMGCQYRLEFDGKGVLQSADWRKSVCDLLYRQYVGGGAGQSEPRLEVFSLMSDVLFSFNKYQLSSHGQDTLDKFIVQLMQRYHNPVVTITGHTDRLGSEQANINISRLRAREVGNQFLARGLPKQNLLIKGVGETSPIVVCDDAQRDAALVSCLSPNRRVEIEIYETP